MAWLIEKYAGALPTWLCPEQVRVLPISEKYIDYANKVLDTLKTFGVHGTVDNRSEKLGYKIREARLDKIPYMLVVGEKEQADGTVSVRKRGVEDALGAFPLNEFANRIATEINTKSLD